MCEGADSLNRHRPAVASGRARPPARRVSAPPTKGVGGCGLAAVGCHGASLSCGGRRQRCRARCGPGCSADILDEQNDYQTRPSVATIARLGRFNTQLPGGTDNGLSPHAAAAQAAPMRRPTSPRTPPRSRCSASFAQQGLLLQVRERSGVLLALALPGLSLPGYGRRSLANLWQMAVRGSRACKRPGVGPACADGLGWSPRRNRTSDPILTMEPPGTAVRTAVSPGRARP